MTLHPAGAADGIVKGFLLSAGAADAIVQSFLHPAGAAEGMMQSCLHPAGAAEVIVKGSPGAETLSGSQAQQYSFQTGESYSEN